MTLVRLLDYHRSDPLPNSGFKKNTKYTDKYFEFLNLKAHLPVSLKLYFRQSIQKKKIYIYIRRSADDDEE